MATDYLWNAPSFTSDGTFTGDLGSALSAVMDRLNQRYVDPSRSTANKTLEAAIREDQNRISLLRELQGIAGDPTRSQAIDAGVQAMMDQAKRTADDAAGAAMGNVTTGAAQTGMLGGSQIGRARDQIAAGRDQSVRAAAASADDWRRGVKDQDQNYLAGVLREIVSPTGASQGAMSAAQRSMQTSLGLEQQLSDANAAQNQILAQTLGGFMQNTVAPGVAGAFQVAGARRDAAARGQPYQSAWQTLMSGG